MAERRMFAKSVVESARFLKMPVYKSKRQFLQMLWMRKAGQFIIQTYRAMILKIVKQHLSIEFRSLMKMEIRRQGYEKVRGRNTFGVRFLFLQMIGMTEQMQKSGESLGQSIVINIWMQSTRLIIVVINVRE